MARIWPYAKDFVTLHIRFIYTINDFESRFIWIQHFLMNI